jgi:drug/metabolite transporter (DMT)-like permease
MTPSHLLILLAAAIWGTAFYFQKIAMLHLEPASFVALRALVAVLVLVPFAVLEGRRAISPLRPELIKSGLLAGVLFLVAGVMQQHGIVTATVINAGFLTALYIVGTPFVYWLVTGTRPATLTFAAATIATVGVWALAGGSFAALSSGDLWIAASTLLWAGLFVVTGAAARHQRPISFTLMATAMHRISAPIAAILLSTEVLFAAAAGILFLDERLTPVACLGAALIFVAVLLARRAPGP